MNWEDTLKREGSSYADHPADRGGPSKFGITLGTLRWWRKNDALTAEDVKLLTVEEAREIYRNQFIEHPGFDKLGESVLKSHLIDFGYHSGPRIAIMNLQDVLGVRSDGLLGPKTLAALEAADASLVNRGLLKRRLMLIARLVKQDRKQAVFLPGWTKRILEFLV